MTVKDPFRKVFMPLSDESNNLIFDMKSKAEELLSLYGKIKSREMSLAITNLEQASMWATKAVVLHDERNTAFNNIFPEQAS